MSGGVNLSCANKISMDDRRINYFALYLCILTGENSDSALKKMGVLPPASKRGGQFRKKNHRTKMAKAFYIFRFVCGESVADLAKRFKITQTYVFDLVKKGRKELIDGGISKTDNDSR